MTLSFKAQSAHSTAHPITAPSTVVPTKAKSPALDPSTLLLAPLRELDEICALLPLLLLLVPLVPLAPVAVAVGVATELVGSETPFMDAAASKGSLPFEL